MPRSLRYVWMCGSDMETHDMETLSTLPAICKGYPPVTDGFPLQKTHD